MTTKSIPIPPSKGAPQGTSSEIKSNGHVSGQTGSNPRSSSGEQIIAEFLGVSREALFDVDFWDRSRKVNRTIKDATVKLYHYDELESLKAHALAFVTAYNFAKRLKALRWRTPYQAICGAWTNAPSIFKINPHHLIPGPNT